MSFVLLFVFVLDLSLLAFQMKNGSPLWVVQRSRSIEGPQEKGEEDNPCDGLETQPPAYGAKRSIRVCKCERRKLPVNELTPLSKMLL